MKDVKYYKVDFMIGWVAYWAVCGEYERCLAFSGNDTFTTDHFNWYIPEEHDRVSILGDWPDRDVTEISKDDAFLGAL